MYADVDCSLPQDRLFLLARLVDQIPPTSLHLIPSIIPEAVLGTKEPSEKARTAAFELIVTMGRKMAEGGVVRRDQMDGMDEGESVEGTNMRSGSLCWCSHEVQSPQTSRSS